MIAAAIDWRVLGTGAFLILIALVLSYRLLSRDKTVRRARYGFYVERDRYEDEADRWHVDPFSAARKAKPAPLPPPTPPPPLPPRPDDETQSWPHRREDA